MKKRLLFLLFLLCSTAAVEAQTRQIKGQVKEAESDNPLPGASVMVRGTRVGTTTNGEGRFTLQIPANQRNPELVVSFVGYLPEVIAIGNQSEINVTLKPDEKLLDEVVVVGYATVNRRDLTGSVSSISEKQLRDIPVTNAVEAMTGRLAGVQVTTSEGAPGADIRVRVRGGGSITQDNSPIYVVDGIQLDNALQTLSPQDIESIDVLKDASATAIYGARGANGVVIITTKSGKTNRTTVSYNGSTGTRHILKTLGVMSPYDYVLYQYEKTRAVANDSIAFLNKYGKFEDLGQYKSAEPLDWQNQVFGSDAPYQTHNISINGGNRTTSYNLSLTKNIEQGIQLESGFDRNLLNFKLDHNISDKFKVGFNTRYLAQTIKGIGTTNSGSASTNRLRHSIQYQPLAVAGGANIEDFDEDYYNATRLSNPVVLTQAEFQRRYGNAANVSGYVSYQILKGLTLRLTAGYDNNSARDDNFYSKITSTARNYATLPVATIRNNVAATLNNSNVLTYSAKKLGGHHNLDVMVGQEFYQTSSRQTFIETRFFPSDITATKALSNMNLGTPPSGQSEPLPITAESLARILSFFGRVNYNYDDRYLATISMRTDGSTKFAPANRWGYFPSGSLAWRFSEEKFMKNQKLLSNGKIRLSYGEAGNNRIADFLYSTLFNTSGVYALGETLIPAFVSPTLANPDLLWETTKSRNAGLDLEFLKGRLQITADVYRNTTENLLVNLPIPSTSGYTTQIKNIGQTSNKGVELQINGTIAKSKDFTWSTSFNIAFNKNNVDNLGPITSQTTNSGWQGSDGADDYLLQVGKPVGLIYGFITDGWYKVDEFDYNATTKVYTLKAGVPNDVAIFGTPQPGTIKLKDLDGDGLVRLENDRTVIGDANPIHTGGWNNQFAYKNFDLSVFVNWVYGNDVYNANKIELTSGYYQNVNMLDVMAGRWVTVNANGRVVKDPTELAALNANATIWQPITNNRPYLHSWAIEDGSFLRINNVTMGYTLPASVARKFKMQNTRIYATVNNLATVTNYSGFDPEANTRRFNPLTPGVDYAAYPRSRTLVIGANVSF
jgi:TonB-linked SusC/RagA family outer membrane protein